MLFDRFHARRVALSAAGALLFSGLCVAGAVTPAMATAPTTTALAAWQRTADSRLDRSMASVPMRVRQFASHDARIGATLTPEGRLRDAKILESSGSHAVDAILLRHAAALRLDQAASDVARAGAVPIQLRILMTDQRPAAADTAIRVAAR